MIVVLLNKRNESILWWISPSMLQKYFVVASFGLYTTRLLGTTSMP